MLSCEWICAFSSMQHNFLRDVISLDAALWVNMCLLINTAWFPWRCDFLRYCSVSEYAASHQYSMISLEMWFLWRLLYEWICAFSSIQHDFLGDVISLEVWFPWRLLSEWIHTSSSITSNLPSPWSLVRQYPTDTDRMNNRTMLFLLLLIYHYI